MGKGDVSHVLFERWLTEPPPRALVDAWKDYVQAFANTMSNAARRALKVGIGKKVSAPEQRVLEELATVFPD